MVRHPQRDHRRWSLGALALSSCFDTPDPPWLLDESVEILAVRADVIEDGPVSGSLGPVPADRLRVEALPGDLVRARVLAASLDGIAADEDIDAAWFLCRDVDCVNDLRDDAMLLPCDGVLAPGDGCALGRGGEITFTMPPIPLVDGGDGQLYPLAWANLGVVMGRPGGPDTDECVERMRQRPYPSLEGCSLFHHQVAGGPGWKVAELTSASMDAETPVPNPLQFLPPDFAPEIERFDVDVRSDTRSHVTVIENGGRVSVTPGDVVTLSPQIDPRDVQLYQFTYGDQGDAVTDVLSVQWFADVAVPTLSVLFSGAPQVFWTVPGDVDSVSFIAIISDRRAGVGWGSITFDVAGSAP